MNLTAVRDIDPDALSASVAFTAEDIELAFSGAPTEEKKSLFFALFGPAWPSLGVPDQLMILAQVAELVLAATQPQTLNLVAGEAELK